MSAKYYFNQDRGNMFCVIPQKEMFSFLKLTTTSKRPVTDCSSWLYFGRRMDFCACSRYLDRLWDSRRLHFSLYWGGFSREKCNLNLHRVLLQSCISDVTLVTSIVTPAVCRNGLVLRYRVHRQINKMAYCLLSTDWLCRSFWILYLFYFNFFVFS
jgi:hypothetical protein